MDARQRSRSTARARYRPTTASRAAGALVVVLGLSNLVFAVMSLTTDVVNLRPAAAGALLVAGALTAGAGALVWSGSGAALLLCLTGFAILLVIELGNLTAPGDEAAPVARVVILAVVVAALAAAQVVRGRRRS